MPDISNWQFPKNVPDMLIGWTADGRGLENKDADDLIGYLGTSTVVATRTELSAIDTTRVHLAFLSEGGREGIFIWTTGNYSAFVAADTLQGVYVAADAVASSSGAWVRVRSKRTFDLAWFGAVATTAFDCEPVFTACVALVKAEGGGTILVSAFYRVQSQIVIDGNTGINLQGTNRESGFYRLTTSGPVFKLSGGKHVVADLLFSSAIYTITPADIVVHVDVAGQSYMERCKIQGGYYPLMVSGNGCTDNTFMNCTITFGMGPAQCIVLDQTGGLNGAHHFYRCTFNQGWPVLSPSLASALYMGARANSTAYNVNEIVTMGTYTWQCRVAGTSAGSAPSTTGIWYGSDLSDGATLKWRLVGHNSFAGIIFESNTYYNTVRECDITGPYLQGILFAHSYGGQEPREIQIETCTIHGPKQIGVFLTAGRNISIDKLNSWNPSDNTASNTYGVFGGNTSGLDITNSQIYNFSDNIRIEAPATSVMGNKLPGGTRGVSVAANIGRFRVIGNDFGLVDSVANASITGVSITAGTANNFQVIGNAMYNVTVPVLNGSTATPEYTIEGNN